MAELNETPESQPELTKEVKNLAMLCHLLGIIGFLGPLVIWLVTKDKHNFINEQGKEALNFQLTILICFAILSISVIGWPLMFVLMVVNIVFVIIAAVRTSEGKAYRYPVAIRLVK